MPKIIKKLASIDIGSNAMRAAFATIDDTGHLRFFKNYRFPIRLGHDVFSGGKISKHRLELTEQAFSELFIELSRHKITEVHAMATSALRDAKNSSLLIESIKKQTGIKIKIIDGKKEANLIKKAIESHISLKNKMALLIDVGGGSTEITLTKDRKILFSKSYQYGTVRLLQSVHLNQIEKDVEQFSQKIRHHLDKHLKGEEINLCIGTGGNLRRMGKLRSQIFKRPMNRVTLVELNGIYSELVNLPKNRRIDKYQMREDRADVIIPAMAMIEQILVDNNIYEILLPKVGLKEGIIIDALSHKPKEIHLQIFEH